jgi:hypothetical protein
MASAVLCRDKAILHMAAEKVLAYLRMLREVMRCGDGANDVLHNSVVEAIHFTCQALNLTS